MRLLLFLLYYGIAFLMGFVIRARFDTWMYSKPHMQERLVIWASDTVSYVESGGPGRCCRRRRPTPRRSRRCSGRRASAGSRAAAGPARLPPRLSRRGWRGTSRSRPTGARARRRPRCVRPERAW